LIHTTALESQEVVLSWQRATQPEQIAQRREEILEAANALYQDKGFDGLSLNGIAREAGLAKSAVYRYFESKEEIFVHFLQEEWEDWIVAFEAALAPLAGSNDAAAVSEAAAETFVARPRLTDLMSLVSRTLEHNLSVEAVVEFKTALLPVTLRSANALHAAMPALQMPMIRKALVHTYSLISGLWPSSHPAETVAEALQRPELEMLRMEFEEELCDGLRFILKGMLAEAQ
jgi:AcrR family transcriptional regulator